MPTAPDPPSTRETGPPGRLAWLDALRGVAALAVVAEHLPWALPPLRPYWFSLGVYGVMVFFLVSGYIIPASLERRGDLRAFWFSRLFRLYPLYLGVCGLVVALSWWVPLREAVPRDGSAVASHLTMLLDVLGLGGVADTMWTLSYEMVFYLLVTALFAVRLHERSGLFAVLFAAASVVAGAALAAAPLPGGPLAYASAAVFTAGLACVMSGRFRTAAACALGLMALTLPVLSGRIPWLGLTILAVMFTGTAIRRWEQGTGTLRPVALAAALVALAPVWAVEAGWWWVEPGVWITTVGGAGLTFAAAMALRGRPMPRPLTSLGLISYSLYLVHHPLFTFLRELIGGLGGAPHVVQAAVAVAAVAASVLVSVLTYRFVERPMQDLGHRLGRSPAGRPPETPAPTRDMARHTN
ncbi:acyltransferase family protein [Sphaerisporangium fuscum]|uniref:acyltransferase family protein n=1 Tax=Sphaerisporangium fuscum TaxID=2835868 RepID=UPI001BDD8FB4|nr:acyltransferase [Sphaerisporangium fuscum]